MPSFKWRNKHDGSVSVSAPPEKLWQSDSESSQPARQGSLPSWSLARDRSNSDASLARRFTRQMSLPITIPFNKRRKSTVLTEPVCQDDCKLLKMFPYEVREMIYLSVVDPRDWTINLREVPEDKRERKKQEKKLKRGEVGSRKTTLHSFLELMPVCRQM